MRKLQGDLILDDVIKETNLNETETQRVATCQVKFIYLSLSLSLKAGPRPT